jgi:hypothetical protein
MRNEIFAAHGRVFPDKQWKDYFAKQAWYKARPAYKISLTEDEKRNLELIDTEEKRRAPK